MPHEQCFKFKASLLLSLSPLSEWLRPAPGLGTGWCEDPLVTELLAFLLKVDKLSLVYGPIPFLSESFRVWECSILSENNSILTGTKVIIIIIIIICPNRSYLMSHYLPLIRPVGIGKVTSYPVCVSPKATLEFQDLYRSPSAQPLCAIGPRQDSFPVVGTSIHPTAQMPLTFQVSRRGVRKGSHRASGHASL